jgi:hypothetical protein
MIGRCRIWVGSKEDLGSRLKSEFIERTWKLPVKEAGCKVLPPDQINILICRFINDFVYRYKDRVMICG